MFEKIIKNIKTIISQMDEDDKNMVLGSLGFIALGFAIVFGWQLRLSSYQNNNGAEKIIETPKIEITEEEPPSVNEPEIIDSSVYENQIHNYKIIDIGNEIVRKNETSLFGLREYSNFIIEYNGITHSVFENPMNLPVVDWVNQRISEKGPRGESFENQKSFLEIAFIREKETPLGKGVEVIRLNGYQSGELFISYKGKILSFSYSVENIRQITEKESARDKLLESIR